MGWRAFVSRHPLASALLAGFVATHLATVTGYWYHGIFLNDLGWPGFNGLLIIPQESTLAQFWAGTVYHYATGISYTVVFALVIHPLLPWRNTVLGNAAKALLFGLVLGTISAAWWVPQLFPALNAGAFSNNLGAKTVIGIYLWHVIYGLNVGAIYNPLPVLVTVPEAATRREPERTATGAPVIAGGAQIDEQ
jgi:hypothetical protein